MRADTEAAIEFKEFFNNFYIADIEWNTCSLQDAILTNCMENDKKKVVLLYLHVNGSVFSRKFCQFLCSENAKFLKDNFFMLGWFLPTSADKELVDLVSRIQNLAAVKELLVSPSSALFCITPNEASFEISQIFKNDFDATHMVLLKIQEDSLNHFGSENMGEISIDEGRKVGYEEYHQIMADQMGDRTYDSFESNQLEELKSKIGYAFYGPPLSETGYTDKQRENILKIYNVIIRETNLFSKHLNRVVISFIFNCLVPFKDEKEERKKEYPDYDPYTDIYPVPVFVLRKCKSKTSSNCCRVIIDHDGRVYDNWMAYLNNNKLHKCIMSVPVNGIYFKNTDAEGKIKLELRSSPACDMGSKVLQVADITSMGVGLASTGVLASTMIGSVAALPLMPVVATVAIGAGAVVGGYSIIRSIFSLADRVEHRQTISFDDSEARGAYLNIVAGSLGFAGAGANLALSQFAARGFNIGNGTRILVNSLNVANLGASGVSLANSGYDIVNQWISDDQPPSPLAILQFTSSILFFGHAIYNFRTANSIVEEVQTKTLNDIKSSLRSNRHRKIFNKLQKQTIKQNSGNVQQGNAEVIKTIRNIPNRDEVFATLTRSNKALNRLGIKFAANNGEISFDGLAVNINEVLDMSKKDIGVFFENLKKYEGAASRPTDADVIFTKKAIEKTFGTFNYNEDILGQISNFWTTTVPSRNVLEKCILIISKLLAILQRDHVKIIDAIDLIFQNKGSRVNKLIEMVSTFLGEKSQYLENQFKLWIIGHTDCYNELFTNIKSKNVSKRLMFFMEHFCNQLLSGPQRFFQDFIKYSINYISKEMLQYQQTTELNENRRQADIPVRKIDCTTCGGYYYSQI